MSNTQFFSPKLVATPSDKEQNRLRILVARPIEFWELFVTKTDDNGEPVKRDDGTLSVTPVRRLKIDGQIGADVKGSREDEKQKLVAAYIVFNYSLNCLQIFSFHQSSLRDAIAAVAGEARMDGKTLADFDITVIKSGDGSKLNTKYSVEVDRQKGKIVYTPVEPEVQEFYQMCKNSGLIKGIALIRNEYPFEGEAAEPMPQNMKRISGLLTSGDGATVKMLIEEQDEEAAGLIFRSLVKKCVNGVITEDGVEYTYNDLVKIRDEKICPF